MLAVMLVAGAAYDSVPARPASDATAREVRSPLADPLYEHRPIFREATARFAAIQPIVLLF
jgi:hypothetical protein